MTSNGLSRKERERLQKRQTILEAARELFAEKGYVDVSMSEIAERAEFATGTLYNFFESKDELYRELVKEFVSKSHALLIQSLEGEGDELARLENFIRVKGEIFKEHWSLARIYISEIRGLGFTESKDFLKGALNNLISRLAEVFQAGIEKGLINDFDPYYLATCLNGMTSFFLIMMLEEPERFDYSRDAGQLMKLFFQNLKPSDESKDT